MNLVDLEPVFVSYIVPNTGTPGPPEFIIKNLSFAAAHGITFLCPLHFRQNANGDKGTHRIHCSFSGKGLPDFWGSQLNGQPSRWAATGTGFADLTLSPTEIDSPVCEWVGSIVNGVAV